MGINIDDTYEYGFDETQRYKCEFVIDFSPVVHFDEWMDHRIFVWITACDGENLKFYEIIKMAFVLMRFGKREKNRIKISISIYTLPVRWERFDLNTKRFTCMWFPNIAYSMGRHILGIRTHTDTADP